MRFSSQIWSQSPRFFLWIGLFALFFRLAVLFSISGTPYFAPSGEDMKFYHDWALRVLAGHGTDGKAFYGMPGYAFLVGGIYFLFGTSPWPVAILQCILDSLNAVIIAFLCSRTFAALGGGPARTIGMLAAVGWVFFLPAQTFSVILMPTVWLVTGFWGLVLWISSSASRSHPIHPANWLGVGLAIGAIAMLVATVLLLIPLAIAGLLLHAARSATGAARVRTALASSVLLVAGIFAGCSPVWIYNRFVAREPVMLSAHSGINYWIGNNPEATGYPKIPAGLRAGQAELLQDSVTLAERASGRTLTRAEVSEYWSARAKAWIDTDRHAWRQLLGRKFANLWNAFQYDDLSIVPQLQSAGVLLPGWKFGLIAALALPGLFLAVITFPRARWIAAAVLLHMFSLMPVFITERYRMCAVPGLLIFAAFSLWWLWDRLTRRQLVPAAALIAGTAVSAFLVSWPRPDPGLWSLDHYNIGLRAHKNGDMETAQSRLELAYAYVPGNAEICFALGTYWHERGDRAKARSFYRKAVEINPNHANTWNNLGVIAVEEKFWAVAERFLEIATRLEPDDAKAHFLLARAQFELKKRDAALSAVTEALRQLPNQPEFLELKARVEATPVESPAATPSKPPQ